MTFMGKSFTTGPDGKLYQLPDQQFANLYWFRYDWFKREDFKKQFKEIYGYELGVPVNWSAYEDIAEFFTEHVREIDGKPFWPQRLWQESTGPGLAFTDAWLSMAGAGDKGIPNGKPVDEWGIRMEGCNPVGASVAAAGPPMVRLPNTPCANIWTGCENTRLRAAWAWIFIPICRFWPMASVAQQIFWYTAFLPSMVEARTHGQRRRHPEMAHGPLTPWALLGRGHEAGLSGLRFLDLHEEHTAQSAARQPGCSPSSAWPRPRR
jgi:glycerol transport system substrate-binding protein